MNRENSTSSLKSLLDMSKDHDLDSCCSESDVFDPPAWRPGRFLQFADIDLTVEDEPSVRPVSLPTERLGPHGLCSSSSGGVGEGGYKSGRVLSSGSSLGSSSYVVEMESGLTSSIRHWRSSVSRRTMLVVTSCMAVALTALTLLSFVLY